MRYIKDLNGNIYRLEEKTVKVAGYDSNDWVQITVLEEVDQSTAREIERELAYEQERKEIKK